MAWRRMTEAEVLEDTTSPYPCQVCKQEFRSLSELRNHPHEKTVKKNVEGSAEQLFAQGSSGAGS